MSTSNPLVIAGLVAACVLSLAGCTTTAHSAKDYLKVEQDFQAQVINEYGDLVRANQALLSDDSDTAKRAAAQMSNALPGMEAECKTYAARFKNLQPADPAWIPLQQSLVDSADCFEREMVAWEKACKAVLKSPSLAPIERDRLGQAVRLAMQQRISVYKVEQRAKQDLKLLGSSAPNTPETSPSRNATL